MDKYIVTKEALKAARTYMPVSEKEAFADTIAEKSIVAHGKDKTSTFRPILAESSRVKAMCLLYALLTYYFGIEFENPMDEDVYDEFASSHIFNQIERFKSDADVKDIVFDLLADYKELEKFVNVAVYNRKTAENDILYRLENSITEFSSPEKMKEMLEQLKQTAEEYTDKVKAVKENDRH